MHTNKKARKIGSILIAFNMIFCSAYATFSDVRPDYWGYEKINEFEKGKYISGYQDGSFKPDNNITRAEFITLINNYYGYAVKDDGIYNFKDISENEWFYDNIVIAGSHGYIIGDGDGNFRPHEFITREEAICILSKILNIQEKEYSDNIEKFKDSESISDWAYKSINVYVSEGFINGYEDGTIRPNKYLTRAEAIQLMNIADEKIIIDEDEEEKEVIIDLPSKPAKAIYYVEYYYENVLESKNGRTGRIGKNAQLAEDDLIPEKGYEIDVEADNVFSGNISKNNDLVLKIYFKKENIDKEIIKWLFEQTNNKESKAYEFFKRGLNSKALNSTGKNFGAFVNEDLKEHFDIDEINFTWRVEKSGNSYTVYFANVDVEELEVGDVVYDAIKYANGEYSIVDMIVKYDSENNNVISE